MKPAFAPWPLYALHFLLALSLPLLLTLLSGCMKAKAIPEDLGPAVSVDTINKALGNMLNASSFNSLAVGQYVDYSTTRRIENEDTAITLGDTRVDLIDRSDTSSQTQFTLKITDSARQADGTFLTTVAQDTLDLVKTPPPPPPAPSPSSPTSPLDLGLLIHPLDGAAAPAPAKTTFHHFHESDATIDPPDPVKARANCSGLSPCSLPVHYIQFDMVIWNTATDYQKISFDLAFSLKTPFVPYGANFDQQLTGLLITDCRSTYIPVSTGSVYVRDCYNLEDFQQ